MTTKLLSISADAKTVKGNALGVLTGILYLAPYDISGYQVCPKSTDACRKTCLFTAGRGVYDTVKKARIRKTKWFFEDRNTFMVQLYNDIKFLVRKAKKLKMVPAVRLNGTSDIAWEKFAVTFDGITYPNLMTAFPEASFYEYTKILNRKSALHIPNYHLTFSLSENNDKEALKALAAGMNVAVVVNTKRKAAKPVTFSGFPAIDGDLSDVRFLDAKGNIILLTAKGKARYDKSGFVKSLDYRIG
jgi:hypothetical protein